MDTKKMTAVEFSDAVENMAVGGTIVAGKLMTVTHPTESVWKLDGGGNGVATITLADDEFSVEYGCSEVDGFFKFYDALENATLAMFG